MGDSFSPSIRLYLCGLSFDDFSCLSIGRIIKRMKIAAQQSVLQSTANRPPSIFLCGHQLKVLHGCYWRTCCWGLKAEKGIGLEVGLWHLFFFFFLGPTSAAFL